MLHMTTTPLRVLLLVLFMGLLSGCNWLGGSSSEEDTDFEEDTEDTSVNTDTVPDVELSQFRFAASKYVQWMPWYLAASENIYQSNSDTSVEVVFEEGSYEGTINRFMSNEVQAVAINNIDAIANFVGRGIDVDVILISSYSKGSDAVLAPPTANSSQISGETAALKRDSVSHYLFERYLLKNQIGFNEVNILDTADNAIKEVFLSGEVQAIATSSPVVNDLLDSGQANLLFSSASIPREIMHLLVVRRDTLDTYPNFGRALLATWFTVVERLQGNRRASTLDSMAGLMDMDRERFDKELSGILLTDTRNKALSSIRDRRRMKKTMRHIRFFMERHNLAGNSDESNWVSYPGRSRALMHFTAKALQDYIAPVEGDSGL